ncbi:14601_t:CDS:2 [Acaulospora morrowiae]|uniref:14601_t:CDS:1 n=1 Tax=Acaulospora morrowiae TaxID=94023 RepID=A0A9N9C6A2_9GLOM|nr:14601_t:CDS:2 [Acaulospora morrowiae]
MNQTRILRAAHKPHVPLIKFLGRRSKDQSPKDPLPKLHPKAPKGSTLPSKTLPLSSSSAFVSSNPIIPQNAKKPSFSVRIFDYSELPDKFKRRVLSNDEIEIIEAGGADYILRQH